MKRENTFNLHRMSLQGCRDIYIYICRFYNQENSFNK